jgi:hypothetical protein
MTKGTPKTLIEACENGHESTVDNEHPAREIRAHMRDYMAQKFAVLRMKYSDSDDMIKEIWNALTQEDL